MPEVDFYICPTCGGEVAVGSPRCFHCEPRKSWEQDAAYDGVDLPLSEEDFDYEEFVREEFGESGGRERGAREWFWAGIALGLLIVFGWMALRGLW